MRIAMMTNNYKPYIGGVPISIDRLAQSLRKLGHTVYIFAPDYPGVCDDDPYVIRYGSFSRKLKGDVRIPNCFDPVIEDIFRFLDIDIIHVHHPMVIGQAALYLGRKYHVPIVFTYHTRYEMYLHYLTPYANLQRRVQESNGLLFPKIGGKVLQSVREHLVPGFIRRFANRCNMIIAPSHTMEQHLYSLGINTPIEVVPTGLPDSAFYPDSHTAAFLRRQLLNGKKYLFCTVSRLAEEKNLSFMLEGLACLKKQIGDCFQIAFLGDGPKKLDLSRQADSLGIGNCVSFLGCIPNEGLASYYHACDAFLFTSLSETQGIVLLEAMATGCPVIAVDASGTRDVVVSGENGFLTKCNLDEWAQKIADVVLNPDLQGHLVSGARQFAMDYHTDKIAVQMQRYYTHTMQQFGYTSGAHKMRVQPNPN